MGAQPTNSDRACTIERADRLSISGIGSMLLGAISLLAYLGGMGYVVYREHVGQPVGPLGIYTFAGLLIVGLVLTLFGFYLIKRAHRLRQSVSPAASDQTN